MVQPANKRLVTEATVGGHVTAEITTPGTPTATALNTTYAGRASAPVAIADYLPSGWVSGQDATSALQAAVADADPGAELIFPEGGLEFPISQIINFKGGQTLTGKAGTTIVQRVWPDYRGFLRWDGGEPGAAATTLTANATKAATTLTVASTAGLAVGATYVLGSDLTFNADGINPTMYRGEQVIIDAILSATSVRVRGAIRNDYATANGASLQPLPLMQGAGLHNVKIVNPEPGQHVGGFVWFRAVEGVRASNVTMFGCDGAGLEVEYCRDVLLEAPRGIDFADDDAATRWGYVVSVVAATHKVQIVAPSGRNVRHVVTTNGRGNKRGVPYDVITTAGVGWDSKSAPWDSHPQGDNISFIGCTSSNISAGAGFQLRSRNSAIVGGSADNCAFGAMLTAAHGSTIGGGWAARNSRRGTVGGYGIQIQATTDATIGDVLIDGTDRSGIYVIEKCDRLRITSGTKVFNPGQAGSGIYSGVYFENSAVGDRVTVQGILAGGTPGVMKSLVEVAATATLTNHVMTDNRGYGMTAAPVVAAGAVLSRNYDISVAKSEPGYLNETNQWTGIQDARRTAAGDIVLQSRASVLGTLPAFLLKADGRHQWGPGDGTYELDLARASAGVLRAGGKLTATQGLGVGNSAAATTPGAVTKKMEIFDASGTSLGFVAIYNSIT